MREDGSGGVIGLARRLTWSEKGWLDLRADLAALPAPRPGRLSLSMEPVDDAAFPGFREEAGRVSGYDRQEVIARQRWLEAGLRRLYVAWSEGQPAYCQWLVLPAELHVLEAANPTAVYEPLAPGEVLLEGAYTFARFRGQGAMADCMGQLLRIARDEGARAAFTCVAEDNVPSLKGCARAGFEAERLRFSSWRLGLHRTSVHPGAESAVWQAIG